MTALLTIDDVACPACGCVCDDLRVRIENNTIARIDPSCPRAERWFAARARQDRPTATIDDHPATLDEAVTRAAEVLAKARCPVILGPCDAIEDQRAAIALAERVGATIDFGGDLAPTLARQQVGQSTCTLGEVRQRADLVILCHCDPAATHPRFLDRFLPQRGLIRVDLDFFAIETLRLLIAGKRMAADPTWIELAARMRAARFGVIVFGSMPLKSCEALLQLVTELNEHTRFYARHLQPWPDCSSVLAWQTGYPATVRFTNGAPRYGPGECSAAEMLTRNEADACLLLSEDSLADLPGTAIARLKTLPVIRLTPTGAALDFKCAVSIATAVRGLHEAGTAFRMDDVAIPLKKLLDVDLPSVATVLEAISRQAPAAVRC